MTQWLRASEDKDDDDKLNEVLASVIHWLYELNRFHNISLLDLDSNMSRPKFYVITVYPARSICPYLHIIQNPRKIYYQTL